VQRRAQRPAPAIPRSPRASTGCRSALAFGVFLELADLNTFAYCAPGPREYMHLRVAEIGPIT
jgi:hypothetical protein